MNQSASIFDNFLLNFFKPAEDQATKDLISNWIHESTPLKRSLLAREIIYDVLEQQVQIKGKKGKRRIKEIVENCERFELLIGHSRTRFQNKFYRDHLDHMIRTALLTSYLIELFNVENSVHSISAGIFHDAGYPVQESSRILESISEALKSGYSILEFPAKFSPSIRNPLYSLIQLSEKTGMKDEKLQSLALIRRDHGVIGAFEFLSCLGEPSEKEIEIAAAICLHSDNTESEILFSHNPIAFIVTLADELQDWGRRAFHEDGRTEITMDKILGLSDQLNSLDLNVRMEYSPNNFPLLEAISSKYDNLVRLRPDDFSPNITIRFPFDKGPLYYESLNVRILTDGFQEPGIRPSNKGWKVYWDKPKARERMLSDRQVAEFSNYSERDVTNIRKLILRYRKPGNKLPLLDQLRNQKCFRYKQSRDFYIADQKLEYIDIYRYEDRIKLRFKTIDRLKAVPGDIIQLDTLPPRVNKRSLFIQLSQSYDLVFRLQRIFHRDENMDDPRLFLIIADLLADGTLGANIHNARYFSIQELKEGEEL